MKKENEERIFGIHAAVGFQLHVFCLAQKVKYYAVLFMTSSAAKTLYQSNSQTHPNQATQPSFCSFFLIIDVQNRM